MAIFDLTALTARDAGRVNAALDKVYRFFGGRTCSLRAHLEEFTIVEKRETDGMIEYDRNHFNRLEGAAQDAYMARLRAKRLYWVNDTLVPKCVFDVVVPPPRFVVVDVGSEGLPVLGKFHTMEQVDAFIVTLPDYLSGRYAVDDLTSEAD